MAQEKIRSTEYLDFLLSKAHQQMYDVGKTSDQALRVCYFLFTLNALLVFGKAAEAEVNVPLLQLSLNKWMASIVVLVMSCAASYWFISTLNSYEDIGHKVASLIDERYNPEGENWWYLHYPSMQFTLSERTYYRPENAHMLKGENKVRAISGNVFLIACFLMPFIYAWYISDGLGYGFLGKLIACIATLILLLPSIVAYLSPSPNELN